MAHCRACERWQLLGDWLRQRAYTIDVATTAGQAVAIVSRQRPDLVLLDVRFPDVSGIQLLKDIKRVDPTIAVIV